MLGTWSIFYDVHYLWLNIIFRNQYWTHKDIPIPIKNSEKQRMKHGFGLKYWFLLFTQWCINVYNDKNLVVNHTALFWTRGPDLTFGNIEDLDRLIIYIRYEYIIYKSRSNPKTRKMFFLLLFLLLLLLCCIYFAYNIII